MLFDENVESIGLRPKEHTESTFDYYNCSARSDVGKIKQLLESWFSHLPQSAQMELRSRFRSPIDSQHRAAIFELLIHELLINLGYSVELHPQTKGNTHPDFLAKKGNKALFYLEVTTSGASSEEVGEQKRIDQVYDTLNRLKNPDFFLAVFVKGAPETAPPGARLRRDLERWLHGLDWQAIRDTFDKGGFEDLPAYEWKHDGWQVKFQPIAKSAESRGELSVRPIALTMPLQVQRLAPEDGIKKAIDAKNKYDLDLPLLVVINLMEDFCKAIDVMNALFGHETVVFSANGTKPGQRLRDGAWDGPQGPQNTSISGVMVFHDLNTWNAGWNRYWLVHNPWAARPLDSNWFPFAQYVPDQQSGTLRLTNVAFTVSDGLKLPTPWPPEEDEEDAAG
jgi:hypothetical protein